MLSFLVKGLLRDRHRSALPIVVVGTGVMLMTTFYGYMVGMMDDMLSTNAKLETGHLKIMTKDYAKIAHQIPNDFAIPHTHQTLKRLNTLDGITWVPRIKFGGLLDIPDDNGETRSQGPVSGVAVDWFRHSSEIKRLDLKGALVEGKQPSQPGEVLISRKMGQNLNIHLEDTATLIGSTASGGMAIYNFKVVGFTHFGIPTLDKNMMFVDITDIQYALDMEDSVGEILGFFDQGYYTKKTAAHFIKQFHTLSIDFPHPLVIQSIKQTAGLGEYIGMIKVSMTIIVGALMLVMSAVIWNSSLMSVLRRYGEIGMRLAMGESKGELLRYLLCESAVVGLTGSILGACIGAGFSYYLQIVGIDISEMMQGSTLLMSPVLRARVTIEGFFIGSIPGVISCLIGTAIAGVGIYKRNTASLFKELEV